MSNDATEQIKLCFDNTDISKSTGIKEGVYPITQGQYETPGQFCYYDSSVTFLLDDGSRSIDNKLTAPSTVTITKDGDNYTVFVDVTMASGGATVQGWFSGTINW